MIERIQIQDYRSCSSCDFRLHPTLSVLIGPNGSGKTNLLNAVMLLKRLVDSHGFRGTDEAKTRTSRLKVWFKIDGKRAILTASIDIYADERNQDVVVRSNEIWYLRDFTGNGKRPNISLAFADQYRRRGMRIRRNEILQFEGLRVSRAGRLQFTEIEVEALDAVGMVAEYLSRLSYYSASQFTDPGRCPVSFETEEIRRYAYSRASPHSRFLSDAYREFKRRTSGPYSQFLDIVGPDGIGLVDGIEFRVIQVSKVNYTVRSGGDVKKRTVENNLVIPQFQIGSQTLSANQLSEGTFRSLTLLFYVVTDASTMLLLEEPEVCVHHGLLASIVDVIRTYSLEKQIVISTHSDFVLGHVLPESVFSVAMDGRDGTRVECITKSMTRDDYAALKEFLSEEGNLGEYWRLGALDE